MPFIQTTLPIPLDGTGTEIPALNITDSYELYEITGTVVSIGNYAIVPTGTPQNGTTFLFDYNGVLDITTNGNTFSIFGLALNQAQLLSKLKITCRYNGSTWKVTVVGSLDQAAITTSSISNNSITNALLATMSISSVKIGNGIGTPTDLALTLDEVPVGNGTTIVPLNINTGIINKGWSILGNTSLTAGTNFIGTNDNVDIVFKRNSVDSGRINTTNTSFGTSTLPTADVAAANTAIGCGALNSDVNGTFNTAIGYNSLVFFNGTGSQNTAIGTTSGNVSDGSRNTFLGANSSSSVGTPINQIALGYGATTIADYQFAIPSDITTVEFGKAVTTTGTHLQKRNTTAVNATATLTASQLHVGYITSTSAAATVLTLPTGTLLGAELGATQGTIFKFYIDNTAGASLVTIAVAVDGILSANAAANGASFGLLTIPANSTGIAEFTIMFNSSTKYVFSRTA